MAAGSIGRDPSSPRSRGAREGALHTRPTARARHEFLRVATHPKVFPAPLAWTEALAFLRPLLDADNVHVLEGTERHWTLLGDVPGPLTHPSGNLFSDVRTAVLMREHGIRRIYTTDTDFLQFAGIEVVNPLRG